MTLNVDRKEPLPDAGDGYAIVWVSDPDWRTDDVEGRKCRFMRCEKDAVARLLRRGKRASSWWCYCDEHLYGRRIRDGVVERIRFVERTDG